MEHPKQYMWHQIFWWYLWSSSTHAFCSQQSTAALLQLTKFFSVNISDQIRAAGIAVAPIALCLAWTDMIHSSHMLSNPLSQEQTRRSRLPQKLGGCELSWTVKLSHDVCDWGLAPQWSPYSHLSAWSWSLGFVGSRSRTVIPSVDTALSRIEPIASTESFSRTSTLHLLSRAAFTWKDGFSVVAPIRIIVPHSTWGRKVSCRWKTHIEWEKRRWKTWEGKREDSEHL